MRQKTPERMIWLNRTNSFSRFYINEPRAAMSASCALCAKARETEPSHYQDATWNRAAEVTRPTTSLQSLSKSVPRCLGYSSLGGRNRLNQTTRKTDSLSPLRPTPAERDLYHPQPYCLFSSL